IRTNLTHWSAEVAAGHPRVGLDVNNARGCEVPRTHHGEPAVRLATDPDIDPTGFGSAGRRRAAEHGEIPASQVEDRARPAPRGDPLRPQDGPAGPTPGRHRLVEETAPCKGIVECPGEAARQVVSDRVPHREDGWNPGP